jgi:hypothetical protein
MGALHTMTPLAEYLGGGCMVGHSSRGTIVVIIRNMIRIIGFRPAGRNPNKVVDLVPVNLWTLGFPLNQS